MLSKSRLMSWRQCPKRLWLEENAPLPETTADGRLARGLSVGELARTLLAPTDAEMVDRSALTPAEAIARTTELLASGRTAIEGAFGDTTLVAYADVARADGNGWRLVEVKDSGSAKPHHIEDAAIQAAAARRSATPADRVLIAHLDTSWTYPGDGDYRGIFREVDITEEATRIGAELDDWIKGATATLEAATAPERGTGRHCGEPYPCPFIPICSAAEGVVERPLEWLPGQLRKEAKSLVASGARSMDDLPDATLNDLQLRVKTQTRLGSEHFDRAGAAADLAACAFPLYFLDFETANPAIPIWAGTRPYAQTPFQFSLHVLSESGPLAHREFLWASGDDPSRPFAEALVEAIGPDGHLIVYNAAFERTRIDELAKRFTDLSEPLRALLPRIFDLQPVAKQRYYHPAQQGSWSIKKVLPCLAPQLDYHDLEGVQDGGMAIEAYLEMIADGCATERRDALNTQLRRYCRLDTLAMVALWARFTDSAQLLQDVIAEARGHATVTPSGAGR